MKTRIVSLVLGFFFLSFGSVIAAKKKLPSSPIDINRATAKDFTRLPRIGKKTAKKIIALRRKLGRFTSVQQLLQVRGIGKRTLQKLRPYIKVRGGRAPAARRKFHFEVQPSRRRFRPPRRTRRPPRRRARRRRRSRRKRNRKGGNCYTRWLQKTRWKPGVRVCINTIGKKELRKLPCIGEKKALAIVSIRTAGGPFINRDGLLQVSGIGKKLITWIEPYIRYRLNLNKASVSDLEKITSLGGNNGVGVAIHQFRKRNGAFRNLRELMRVPGIGRSTYERIKDLFVVRRSKKKRFRRRRRTKKKKNVRLKPEKREVITID